MHIDEIRIRYMMDGWVKESNYDRRKKLGMSEDQIRADWQKETRGRIPFETWAKTVHEFPEIMKNRKKREKPKSTNIYDPSNRKKLEKWKQRQAVEKSFEAFKKMTPEQQREERLRQQNKMDQYRANVMRQFAQTH